MIKKCNRDKQDPIFIINFACKDDLCIFMAFFIELYHAGKIVYDHV